MSAVTLLVLVAIIAIAINIWIRYLPNSEYTEYYEPRAF